MLGSLQLLFRQLEFQFASSLIVVIWKVIDWIEARQSDGKHDVLLLAGRDSVFAQTTAVPGNMPGIASSHQRPRCHRQIKHCHANLP